MADRKVIERKFKLLTATFDERGRRLWAGAEAEAIGYGGVAAVAAATGLAISTVRKGRDELRAGAPSTGLVRSRKAGGGRPRHEVKDPGLRERLLSLVEPTTRGDPESPLRWTCKSTRTLARELGRSGAPISPQKVGSLLRSFGFSLQGTSRVKEGDAHPDRNAQFECINGLAKGFIERGVPVISVDTKKKENVGEFSNRGREWHPQGKAVEVSTYDFPDPETPKAIPYGVYDVANNDAYVNVGIDHDTPTFAVRSIELWWNKMGSVRYPNARELFVTADGGGSNSYKSRVWKARLQAMADRYGLTIHVSHFPPGTSKWNKIEHRLFSFISINWRGRPLTNYASIVALIASTTTSKGLRVNAELDNSRYPLGAGVTEHEMRGLALSAGALRGAWNYALRPRTTEELAAANRAPPLIKKYQRREHWEKVMLDFTASGLSQRQYCIRNGISRAAFHSQKIKLRGRDPSTRKPRSSS
jgi:hypothetical protein